MNKYIDADLLRRKIAEQMESVPREVGRGADTITSKGYGMMEAFQIVRSIIDSLQQEQQEVDLEKEIEKYCRIYYNCNYPDQTQNGRCSPVMPHIVEAARHFYELGLNARKEE